MPRTELERQVFARGHSSCVACGLDAPSTLQVHHKIPRSLGGLDSLANLCLLCANCHRLVHVFSVGRRLEGAGWSRIVHQMSEGPATVIPELAQVIRRKYQRNLIANNRWTTEVDAQGSIDIDTAIVRVAERNGYVEAERAEFIRAASLLLDHTPTDVLRRCSLRLLKTSRYLSVNAGNHLLFRVPAYSDGGAPQRADAFVIWPSSAGVDAWTIEQRIESVAFEFRLFSAVTLTMSSGDIATLTSGDWTRYSSACESARSCQKTRDWPSNVTLRADA